MDDKRQPAVIGRNKIIAIALIISVLLYCAGVFSGLYANKIFEERAKADMASLKDQNEQSLLQLENRTRNDISSLKEYISVLETNQKGLQLEESFSTTLSHDKMCEFSTIIVNGLMDQIYNYWRKMPFRIEEYELNNNNLSEEYIGLKKQVTPLLLRTWIVTRNKYENCNTDFIPILYFFSKDCEVCVAQGERLDDLRSISVEDGKRLIVFTVDINSEEPMISYLKQYYKINSTPAMIINDQVFQGRIFYPDEIISSLGMSKDVQKDG
jgi:hypothetical protein